MKNITLSVDDKVLAEVRRYASQRNTTVNALVRDYLTRLATQEDRAAKARKRLLELAEESTAEIGPITWKREDLYDRPIFSRYQHSGVRDVPEGGGDGEKDDGD